MAGPAQAAPALPEEREKQHLPSKSYADAVEEVSITKEYDNGLINGDLAQSNGKIEHDTIPNGAHQNGPKHKASVLRIVDTAPSEPTKATEAANLQEPRPQVHRQESKSEYSATVCTQHYLPGLVLTF